MRQLAERAYFGLCLMLGRLLRSARYSKVRIVDQGGERRVRKQRAFYAPLVIWSGGLLVRLLDAGVRVLPQRDWEERERQVYRTIHGTSIRVNADRSLVLPRLAGTTLADLLEDRASGDSVRTSAIELAVAALADFHAHGFTHGDAMAENVLVDLEAGVAHWFDFETVHDPSRPMSWRRTDDVRALLATCLIRTGPERIPDTLEVILSAYGDEAVSRVVGSSFSTVFRRALVFHLGQAPLSFESFRGIHRLLESARPDNRIIRRSWAHPPRSRADGSRTRPRTRASESDEAP